MAKYAINEDGIDQLKFLASKLSNSVEEIYQSCARLEKIINAIGSDLGVYQEDILSCTLDILRVNKRAAEYVGVIVNKDIPHKIEQIRAFMSWPDRNDGSSRYLNSQEQELRWMIKELESQPDGTAGSSDPQKVYRIHK